MPLLLLLLLHTYTFLSPGLNIPTWKRTDGLLHDMRFFT
jgi:hypothetical protein